MNTNLVSSSSVFNFSAEHNGVQCIESLKPEDRGNARQYWFTAKLLATIFECSEDTIRRRIETLVLTGDIVYPQICGYIKMPDSLGRMNKETVIYNLTVFNKIGMTFIDNPKAVEIRGKFNDVLTKAETQPQIELPKTYLEALKALVVSEEEKEKLIAERDELKRTKAFITAGRESTVMGKLGGTTKALICEREKNTKLLKENDELKEQNEILKVSIGESIQWMSSAQLIQNFDLQRINGKTVNTKSLTTMLKKCGCRNKMSEFPDKSGYKYTIFFVEDVKKALNIF